MWYFCIWHFFFANWSQVQRWSTHWKHLALKLLIFFPNLKLGFIVIVVVRICLTHSNRCSFTKNMSRRAPMGTIRRPSDSGSGGTEGTDFIKYIKYQETQINLLWCLGLGRIFWKFHPTARVEVPTGTAVEFVTDYLAGNGRRINIIRQLYVNDSVQFLGLSDQAWGSGLLFITNLLAHVESTGWGSYNNSNQSWVGRFNNANII